MLIYEKKVEEVKGVYGTAKNVIPSDADELLIESEELRYKKWFNDGKGGIVDADGKEIVVVVDGEVIIPKGGKNPHEADPENPESIKDIIDEAIAEGKDVTVIVDADMESHGIIIPEGTNITFDLGESEVSAIPDENGEYAGSGKTKTQAMQFLKDSTVVIKGGTITGNNGNPPTKMVIQNYSNLTLDGVIVQDAGKDTYVLSNNFGEIHLKNGTQLNATGNHVAFDLWYGMNKDGLYDDGVTVYIDTPDVVINGPIEFGHASRIKDEEQFLAKTHLYVCEGYDISSLNVINSTSGSSVEYEFVFNEEIGYFELVPKSNEEPEEVPSGN